MSPTKSISLNISAICLIHIPYIITRTIEFIFKIYYFMYASVILMLRSLPLLNKYKTQLSLAHNDRLLFVSVYTRLPGWLAKPIIIIVSGRKHNLA